MSFIRFSSQPTLSFAKWYLHSESSYSNATKLLIKFKQSSLNLESGTFSSNSNLSHYVLVHFHILMCVDDVRTGKLFKMNFQTKTNLERISILLFGKKSNKITTTLMVTLMIRPHRSMFFNLNRIVCITHLGLRLLAQTLCLDHFVF